MCPQLTPKVEKLESVQTLLIITQLDYEKSYLIIIVPNAHVRLTKRDIRLSWSSFETLLEIIRLGDINSSIIRLPSVHRI